MLLSPSTRFCVNLVSKCHSFYTVGQVTPINGLVTTGVSKPQSAALASSTSSQTGKDSDFSSLTQGMFAKH